MARLFFALLFGGAAMAVPILDALPNGLVERSVDVVDGNNVAFRHIGTGSHRLDHHDPPRDEAQAHNNCPSIEGFSHGRKDCPRSEAEALSKIVCPGTHRQSCHSVRDDTASALTSTDDILAREIILPPGFIPPPPGMPWPHSIVMPFATPKGFTGFAPGVGHPPRTLSESRSPTATNHPEEISLASPSASLDDISPSELVHHPGFVSPPCVASNPTPTSSVDTKASREEVWRLSDRSAHPHRSVIASLPMPTDYCSTVVYQTNLHRMNHSAPLVTYNNTMAEVAHEKIKDCASNPVELFGSNFAQYWGSGLNPYDPASATVQAIKDWYETEQVAYAAASEDYTKFPTFSNFNSWGHFSQMVWVNEAQIGCWSISCGSDTPFAESLGSPDWSWAVVCASSPAGNGGSYMNNVKPPIGMAPSDYSTQNNTPCH